jgi:hypothetical protein
MKEVAWMAGLSVGAWLVVAGVVDAETRVAVMFGMLAPLAAACVSWVMAERTYRRQPAALTGLMATAFVLKLVLFGGYVAVMLRVVGLRPVPFTLGFIGYFIALHVVEAFFLKRLFAGGSRA